jgi:hypothetical protein
MALASSDHRSLTRAMDGIAETFARNQSEWVAFVLLTVNRRRRLTL